MKLLEREPIQLHTWRLQSYFLTMVLQLMHWSADHEKWYTRCSAPHSGHLIKRPEALARVERVTGPQRSLPTRGLLELVKRLEKLFMLAELE